jgi:hypothetical protein
MSVMDDSLLFNQNQPAVSDQAPAAAAVMEPPLSPARVQVLDPQGAPVRDIELTAAGVTIGRLPTNDLPLDAPTVSRQHLRIDWDGQQATVTDLGSRGGTLLGDVLLMPHAAQPWNPRTPLRIGPFQLQLLAEAPPAPPPVVGDPERLAVSLVAGQEVLEITPGQPTVVNLIVANRGQEADRILIEAQGVPADWIETPTEPLPLDPGGQTFIPLSVTVPVESQSRTGAYNLVFRARSVERPLDAGTVQAQWFVRPFAQSNLDVQPRRAHGREQAVYSIHINNQGNAPVHYGLSAVDDELALNYVFTQPDLTIEPGQAIDVPMTALVEQRRIGRGRRYTITVSAEAADEMPYIATTEFVQDSYLPLWTLAALPLLALLLALCLFGLLPGSNRRRRSDFWRRRREYCRRRPANRRRADGRSNHAANCDADDTANGDTSTNRDTKAGSHGATDRCGTNRRPADERADKRADPGDRQAGGLNLQRLTSRRRPGQQRHDLCRDVVRYLGDDGDDRLCHAGR